MELQQNTANLKAVLNRVEYVVMSFQLFSQEERFKYKKRVKNYHMMIGRFSSFSCSPTCLPCVDDSLEYGCLIMIISIVN